MTAFYVFLILLQFVQLGAVAGLFLYLRGRNRRLQKALTTQRWMMNTILEHLRIGENASGDPLYGRLEEVLIRTRLMNEAQLPAILRSLHLPALVPSNPAKPASLEEVLLRVKLINEAQLPAIFQALHLPNSQSSAVPGQPPISHPNSSQGVGAP